MVGGWVDNGSGWWLSEFKIIGEFKMVGGRLNEMGV